MGRIDFVRGVLLFVLLVPSSTPGFSHASDRSVFGVAGTIFADGTNARIARAGTILCDDGGNALQESSANESGEFSFQGLRPGHYIVRVQAIGFESAELHIDLSIASERGLSVVLKPAHSTAPPRPDGETISAHELAMPEAARDLLASGKKKLYAQKDAQSALRDFQTATQKAPTFYEAYYQAGMAYLSLQNSAEAENQFRKSVDISGKKCADADIALGTLLLHRGVGNEGEALLREGLAGNPNSWPGQFELGELELSRGHADPALAAAEKAEALAPNQPVVYRLLAVIHLRQKNYPALVTDLDAYLQLDPNSPAGVRAKELRADAQKQILNSPGTAVSVNK
jgi:tetratricopeptide (TPR) repeat protein